MKKQYQTPAIVAVQIEVTNLMGTASKVEGNASLQMGGGSSGVARGRGGESWDDED